MMQAGIGSEQAQFLCVVNVRFQTNGVDLTVDALQAAHEDPDDVRERLWQVIWARGYQDILIPMPAPDTRIDAYVIYERAFAGGTTLLAVDDGERLISIFGKIRSTPLGAKVRLQPLYGASSMWSVKVLTALGCGLSVRFDEPEGRTTDVGWVDRLRGALHTVREHEVAVRRRIDNERRTLEYVQGPPPFRQQMEEADKALRESVLSSGYTEEESRQLARAKTPDAVQRLVTSRNKHLVDLYRAQVVEFRARIPELRAEWDKKMDAYAAFRNSIDRFNSVDTSSRAITDESLRCTQMLDTIEAASLNVHAADLSMFEADPRAHFTEISSTIELLFELVPKRVQRQQEKTTV